MGTPKSMTKAELLERMRTGRAEWETLLAEVGEARMTEPGVEGEWSVKDVAAHIMVYERWVAGNLGGAVPEEPPAPPEVDMDDQDARNAWFHARHRDSPLGNVLAESRQVHEQLRDLVQALPEGEVGARFGITPEGKLRPATESDGPHWPLWSIIDGNAGGHYFDHLPALRAWLGRARGR